jgi:hypothetical protein
MNRKLYNFYISIGKGVIAHFRKAYAIIYGQNFKLLETVKMGVS